MALQLSESKRKYVQKLTRDQGFRKEENLYVLEHEKAIKELIQENPGSIHCLVQSDTYSDAFPETIERYSVAETLFNQLSTVKTPRGVMAIVKRPRFEDSVLKKARCIVALDRVQNPQNVGAIMRNALAFGVDAVVLLEGTADPLHPDALRSMASHGRNLPFFILSVDNCLATLKDFTWVGLTPHGKKKLGDFSAQQNYVFVFGSEGAGLSQSISCFEGLEELYIPMSDQAESLNVAVSSGIVLFSFFKAIM